MATTKAANMETRPAGAYPSRWALPCGPITNANYGPGYFWGPPVSSPTTPFTWASSCGPSGWDLETASTTAGLPRLGVPSSVAYYSPAICPSGYTVACTWGNTGQGPTPTSGETAVNCLPSGYACGTLLFDGIKSTEDWAPMIPIRWAQSDLSTLETHPLTPGLFMATVTSSSRTRMALPTGSSSSSSTTDEMPREKTLSNAAIAGIAIGAIAGAILLIGLLVVLIRKRRAQAKAQSAGSDGDSPVGPEGDGNSGAKAMVTELDTSREAPPTAELPHFHQTAHEIDSERKLQYEAQEMPVDQPPHPRQVVVAPSAQTESTTVVPNNQSQAPLSSPAAGSPEAHAVSRLGPEHYTQDKEVVEVPFNAVAHGDYGQHSSTAAAGAGRDELAMLLQRQSQIEAQKQRLIQLQQLDEEEEMVRRRIAELQRGNPRAGS